MQVLADALPGFRGLRSPILAGYGWLLFAWLIVDPNFGRRPHHQALGAALYDAAHRVGTVGVALSLSVCAYLVGSASQSLSPVLRIAWMGVRLASFWRLPYSHMHGDAERRIKAIEERGLNGLPDKSCDMRRKITRRASDVQREARNELALPATLLLGNQPSLFAEVDRLRAESDLRLSLIPPLLGLTLLAAYMVSPWWLCVLPLLGVILDEGVRRDYQSRRLIADATSRGLVKSASIDSYEAWVDGVLGGLSRDLSIGIALPPR